jgi:hypothetical protein
MSDHSEILESRSSGSGDGTPRSGFGTGPLSRAAALIYTLLVVDALIVLAALPGLVPLALLGRDASNLPLVALCLVPLGPALSAAVYAVRHRSADVTDLTPATAFRRGYRANLRGALAVWVPALLWLTVVVMSLANFTAAGVPGWWAVLLVLVGAGVALWATHALVIASLFAFRARDVARLAAHVLTRTPGVTVCHAALLVVAAGVALVSEVLLGLLASVFVLALVAVSGPMLARIRADFTA